MSHVPGLHFPTIGLRRAMRACRRQLQRAVHMENPFPILPSSGGGRARQGWRQLDEGDFPTGNNEASNNPRREATQRALAETEPVDHTRSRREPPPHGLNVPEPREVSPPAEAAATPAAEDNGPEEPGSVAGHVYAELVFPVLDDAPNGDNLFHDSFQEPVGVVVCPPTDCRLPSYQEATAAPDNFSVRQRTTRPPQQDVDTHTHQLSPYVVWSLATPITAHPQQFMMVSCELRPHS